MPRPFPLKILFENKNYMALNKPACLHSAALPGGGGDSVADLLQKRWPGLSQVSPKPEDAGLVNRLDYETSGILLMARNPKAWQALHRLILDCGFYKSYLALVEGVVGKRQRIEAFLGASGRSAKKVRAFSRNSTKHRTQPAVSTMTPLAKDTTGNFSLVRFEIETGRRHQIRAHSAFVGYPLAGDTLYGAKTGFCAEHHNTPGIKPGFFLHAEKIVFCDPWTNERISISSELPPYWPEFCHLPLSDR